MKTMNTPTKTAPKTQRLGRAPKAETHETVTARFTLINDRDGQAALKLVKSLIAVNNEHEKSKAASSNKDYTPRIVHITVLGRIGRNVLFGPRYRNRPAGREDRSQDKHTTSLETARTLDVYLTT